jgi:dipeptidyl-peptidase-4
VGRSQAALPIEEVARVPAPGAGIPVSLAFSPDDRFLTFLQGEPDSLHRKLHGMDLEEGGLWEWTAPDGPTDGDLSLEETLRRERQRELGQGVTRYAWAERANVLMVPLPDSVYVAEVGTHAAASPPELRRVLGDDPVVAPGLSPDGTKICFVRDGDLNVVSVRGGEARRITKGAEETGVARGVAEYVAQEEMGRSSGYWWSPDGAYLALTEVDESMVPPYRIVHEGSASPQDYEEHRFPFAGHANAQVRLGVMAADGGEVEWLDLGEDDHYLARAGWLPDGRVVAQVQNRAQTRLRLLAFGRSGRGRQPLLEESSPMWVNLHDLFRPLEATGTKYEGAFVWASERSGFRHLYLCDGDGSFIRALTGGEWMVDSLDGVDEEGGLVYFSGTRDGPTERHLYVVSLEAGEPRRLTAEAGTHHVVVDHSCRRFVDVHSALDRPPTVTLRALPDGQELEVVHDRPDPRVARLGLVPPRLVSVPASDGTMLHGLVHRPDAGEGSASGFTAPPAVVSVYGGPHVQRAVNSWAGTCDMRAQHLRRLGYLVIVLDNRGGPRRGVAFETAIFHDLGNLEVRDQVDGVSWLAGQGLIDPERVGIYGWSYGGYMAAMCLARAPEVFRAAVAGAPVTHWDGYDTHYTERYMGTPAENPDGYERSSVMHHVDAIVGDLLLVHGLLDENVHFRHTARLVNALVKAGKPYGLVLFPEERHLPRSMDDRVYMEERLRDFFEERL